MWGCAQTQTEAPVRRLTPQEYNHTIRDLLGYAVDEDFVLPREAGTTPDAVWPWSFPGDVEIEGFEGMTAGQTSSAYLAEQYQQSAAHFAELALVAPAFWQCDRSQEPLDAACARASVHRFAERAWRRPLTGEQLSRLEAFHQDNVDQHGLDDGTRLTVTGVLLSPHFLFRVELDGPAHDGWERAEHLSYFLWDSMPDDALFAAAAAGELDSVEGVEAQARRMVEDPRTREMVVRFHDQWLGVDDIYEQNISADAYGEYYAHIFDVVLDDPDPQSAFPEQDLEETWSSALIGMRYGLHREYQRFVEETLFDRGGTLGDLLTDNHGYVVSFVSFTNQTVDTSELYGVTDTDHTGGDVLTETLDDSNLAYELTWTPVTFPSTQRSGLFTLGSVLWTHAHPVHPAPVLRGKNLLERLFCDDQGQPPPGAEDQAPTDSVEATGTNRERLHAVTSTGGCEACHDALNAAGFAFENYDSMGRWRDTDNGETVDASGVLETGDGTLSFTDAVDLMGQLATDEQVHRCYATQWTRYALGRLETDADADALDALQQDFVTSGGDVQELLVDIATSELFLGHRRVDTGEVP